jgi:uncharacterized protein YhaN
MRLRRLDLTRFGVFTGGRIDFGAAEPGRRDLHLVYGPNEAGKTTAAAAYLDLLYGIKSTRYAFLHPEAMEIGGALEIGGQVQEFVRIKAASNSLLDVHGQPVAESAIRAELGAIERDGYCSMFSLDDDTLEKGGKEILDSRGDLGQLLFAASAGLAELSQQLAAVRDEANAFHKPGGRSTRLSQLKDALTQLKTERDAIDTHAQKHHELIETRDRLAEQYQAALATRNRTQVEIGETRRNLLVLPSLIRLRNLRHDLAPLAALPDAPAVWWEELPRLLKQELTLGHGMATARARIDAIAAEIEAATIDPAALALADRMEDLGQLKARHLTALKDVPRLEDELAGMDSEIRRLLREAGRDPEEDPELLLLEAASVARIRGLIESWSRLDTERQLAAAEFDRAKLDLADATAALEEAGAAVEIDALGEAQRIELAAAAAAARAVDHAGRCRAATRARDKAASVLETQLDALAPWRGAAAALAALRIPEGETIQGWRRSLAEAERRIDLQRGEVDRLTAELGRLAAQADAIGASGGFVGDADAVACRAAREQAWAAHRRALDAGTAEAFEAALRHDDLAIESRMRHDAERSKLQRIREDSALRTSDCRLAQESLAAAQAERQAVLSAIAGGLRAFLPEETSLAQLEAWLQNRAAALEANRQAAAAAAELSAVEEEAAAAVHRLAAALKAIRQPVEPDAGIETLAAAAEAIANAKSGLDRLAADLRKRRQEVQRREGDSARADAAAQAWSEAWAEACAGCWLGAGGKVPSRERARAALAMASELGPILAKKSDHGRRILGMQRDQGKFAAAIAAMAEALGIATEDVVAASKIIADRVSEAGKAQARRSEKEAELAKAEGQLQAQAEEQVMLEAAKARLTGAFGVASLEEVDGKLAALRKRQELGGHLAQTAAEIVEAVGVDTVEEAEAMLGVLDRAALEAALIGLEARFKDEDQSCSKLFSEKENAIAAVDRIGGDAAVAALEERRRTVLVEIEEGARDYLRLRMGTAATEQALRIYRDRHRSSMMQRASEAFRLVSRGAYARLEPQRRKDSEVLVAIPANGGSKDADQLSKGTRFQLYLALRVAGYHEFARTRSAVPFISDDIMETFDDFRAEEAFRLFGEMAEIGQVIYFTHHRHLCEIARQVCPELRIHSLERGAIGPEKP